MWNSSNRRGRAARIGLAALALIGLSTAVVAGLEQGGQAADDPVEVIPAPTPVQDEAPMTVVQANPGGKSAAKGQPGYQLRCWQYGRLLFDERNLDAPAPAGRYALAMQAGGGASLQVVDLGSATCLIQRRTASADRR